MNHTIQPEETIRARLARIRQEEKLAEKQPKKRLKRRPKKQEGKTMAQTASEYLTPQELVQRWNGAVTTGTLANWRNQGKGPAYTKFGSRVRYKLNSVEQYEKSNMIGANDNDER